MNTKADQMFKIKTAILALFNSSFCYLDEGETKILETDDLVTILSELVDSVKSVNKVYKSEEIQ